MFSTKEEKAKEELKAAWKDNNLAKLLYIGLAKFMDLVCGDGPLPFQKFLKYTGDYFDQCILDISQNKQLNYVGGKMIMELKESNRDAPASVLLSADLYFQTSDKQWVMEKSMDRFLWIVLRIGILTLMQLNFRKTEDWSYRSSLLRQE